MVYIRNFALKGGDMKKLLWIGIPIILIVAIAAQLYLPGRKSSNINNNVEQKPKIREESSYSIEAMTLKEMIKRVDGILIGKVTNVMDPYLIDIPPVSKDSEPSHSVMSEATIEVEKWLVNSKDFPNRFNIGWLGGEVTVGDTIIETDSLASVNKGERILLFVDEINYFQKYQKIVPTVFELSGKNAALRDPDGTLGERTTLGEINKLIKELRTSSN